MTEIKSPSQIVGNFSACLLVDILYYKAANSYGEFVGELLPKDIFIYIKIYVCIYKVTCSVSSRPFI